MEYYGHYWVFVIICTAVYPGHSYSLAGKGSNSCSGTGEQGYCYYLVVRVGNKLKTTCMDLPF